MRVLVPLAPLEMLVIAVERVVAFVQFGMEVEDGRLDLHDGRVELEAGEGDGGGLGYW